MRRKDLVFFVGLVFLLAVSGGLAAQGDPDLPPGGRGRIDKATYLRCGGEHSATLRGLKTPVPAYAASRPSGCWSSRSVP